MILLTEMSGRRSVCVDTHEVVLVIRVDTERGHIDLSKRLAATHDVVGFMDKFRKAKMVG